MQTPWGHLKNIDLTDHNLCEAILSADKHQLVEGLVVETSSTRSSRGFAERERAALIGVELDHERVAAMFGGRQGILPDHTTFTGSGSFNYRSLCARDFGRIGMITDQRALLAERLAQALTRNALPQVSDR